MGTLHENLCRFIIIYRWILLGMRNVPDKSRRENQNTLFVFNHFIFRKSLRLWDNVKKCGRVGQTTDESMIRHLRFECRISFHSFSSLSYDRSKASSKASSPQSAIQSFLFQMRVSSPFFKVIQYLSTSSSVSSCHFYLPLYLSFNNPL